MATSPQFGDQQSRQRELLVPTATVLLLGVAAIVWTRVAHVTITTPKPLLSPLLGNPPLAFFLHGTQATIIFFFVRKHTKWLRRIKTDLFDKTADVPIQKETLKQFTRGWEWMWWAWFALYTWFTIAALLAQQLVQLGKSAWWVESISDTADVISSGAIWWCYLSLDLKSVNVQANDDRKRPFSNGVAFVAVAGIACSVLAVMDRKNDWGHFGVVLVGVFSALGLASFTGRIGSHFIGTRRWALTLLYFYAILQVFYSLMPDLTKNTQYWLPAVYVSVLLLKIVLAVAGSEMMKNGRLIRYLEAAESGLLEASELDDTQWQDLRERASAIWWKGRQFTKAAPVDAAARAASPSSQDVLTSVLGWTDERILRLMSLINFRSSSFYLTVIAVSLLLTLTMVAPADFLVGKTVVIVLGLFVGISSSLALLKEGFEPSRYTAARICFIVAAFLMFMEIALVVQMGIHLHHG